MWKKARKFKVKISENRETFNAQKQIYNIQPIKSIQTPDSIKYLKFYIWTAEERNELSGKH